MYKLFGSLATIATLFWSGLALSNANIDTLVTQKKWIHGSADCDSNQDPAIDILKLDDSSYILRQNKCLHYEAPFIYLFMGRHTAFLQDTGATASHDSFPLYETVKALMNKWEKLQNLSPLRLLVTHSHGHSDHKAADEQFRGKPNVTLIEPSVSAVKSYFSFNNWPAGSKTLDLGHRTLEIVPLPGHKSDAIAVHDSQTNVMLTGDTFYPGRLYIKDENAFRASIKRLVAIAKHRNIKTFLGTHIEMKNEVGKDYPIGSTYQPNESSLILTMHDLVSLDSALDAQASPLVKQALNKVIIYPVK